MLKKKDKLFPGFINRGFRLRSSILGMLGVVGMLIDPCQLHLIPAAYYRQCHRRQILCGTG